MHTHKNNLSAPIPREEQQIHAIIGVQDLPKIYRSLKRWEGQCPEVCVVYRSDSVDSAIEAWLSIFGTVLTGVFNTYDHQGIINNRMIVQNLNCKTCNKNHKQTNLHYTNSKPIFPDEESILLNNEIPLDILLKHAIGCSYDDAATQKEDRSAFQTTAHKASEKMCHW